jgi:hypothetical protein
MELLAEQEILTLYIYGLTFGTSICCTMFQNRMNAESFPVSQLCVNTLPATKITQLQMGFNSVA